MPIAKPTRLASSPPGYRRASRANTGRTRNRPSIRAANTTASEPLARRSSRVREEAGRGWEGRDGGPTAKGEGEKRWFVRDRGQRPGPGVSGRASPPLARRLPGGG